jgi:hypothetical protein
MGISRIGKQEGHTMIFTISLVLIFIIILLALFDMCRIYIAREAVKTASESIALAVSQELIYFRQEDARILAEDIASKNGCRLTAIHTGYDEVVVSVKKEMNMAVLKEIGLVNLEAVSSSSRVKVMYPWDRRWKECRYYEFGYKPY